MLIIKLNKYKFYYFDEIHTGACAYFDEEKEKKTHIFLNLYKNLI